MYHYFFFLMIRQPQRSTLFPHTLLARFQPRALPRRDGSVDPAARVGLSDHLKDHPRVLPRHLPGPVEEDRKSTRLNSSHQIISYAVFCLKKKKTLMMHIPDADLHLVHTL